MFRPAVRRLMYSSSLPGIEARATVTWTPRTSAGSGLGWSAIGVAAVVASPVDVFRARGGRRQSRSRSSTSLAPTPTAAPAHMSEPSRATRRRRFACAPVRAVLRNRELGSSGSKSIDTARER